MAQRIDPVCDVCGTEMNFRHGIGSYCPNANCGGEQTPEQLVADTPPADGRFVKLGSPSVMMVLEENLREKTTLTGVDAIDLYGVMADGTERRLTSVKLQLKPVEPTARPIPVRHTAPSRRFPKGFPVTLATRDGVLL